MSVLVNILLTQEFVPSCGLRLGDLLSPLLFDLVVEVLGTMIKKSIDDGSFSRIKIAEGNVVSHVQFADDTLIFINNDMRSDEVIREILARFQLLSGLKINFAKSKL